MHSLQVYMWRIVWTQLAIYNYIICNRYNMDMRALAHLLHEGAKRPRAINELSARASMYGFIMQQILLYHQHGRLGLLHHVSVLDTWWSACTDCKHLLIYAQLWCNSTLIWGHRSEGKLTLWAVFLKSWAVCKQNAIYNVIFVHKYALCIIRYGLHW